MQHNKNYRGDSPAKKLSRLQFWFHVRGLLGEKRFFEGPHLVLASREAGDVSVLLGMGVSLDRIVGVDWKPHEAALAQVKFPGLRVHVDDVADFAVKTRTKFACAFLDFCAQSTSDYFDRVVTVARSCVLDDGLTGCAFMVGREKTMKAAAMRYRREVQRQIARMDKARRRDVESLDQYFSRAFLIQNEIEKRSKRELQLDSRFYYSSKIDGWHGHPWCGSLFWTRPKKRRIKEPACFYFDSTEQDLREQVLALHKKKWPAGLLLNVSKTSMAAWKAHATRGTYKSL